MSRKVFTLLVVIVFGIAFGFIGCKKGDDGKMQPSTMENADTMKKDTVKQDNTMMKKDDSMKKDSPKM